MAQRYSYIFQDNKKVASRVVNEIFNKTQILSSFPKIGYKYQNDNKLEIRVLLYEHYRIVYLIKDDKNIDILGIFHGSLDIERYL